MPSEHFETYETAARDAGLPLSDYIALVLAERHGLPLPDYVVKAQRAHQLRQAQEEAAYPISA